MPAGSVTPFGRALALLAAGALVLLSAVLSLGATAGPASAATPAAAMPAAKPADCGLGGFTEQLGDTGRLVLVGVVKTRGEQIGESARDGYRYDVRVRRQLPDGADPTLARVVTVTQVRDGREPIQRLSVGEPYFFSVQGKRDTFMADGCASVLPYQSELEPEIEDALAGGSEQTGGHDYTLDEAADDGAGATLGRAVAPGLAITLVGVLGLIAFLIASRRPS